MKVLKFGGKSLASGQSFDKVIQIIKSKTEQGKIAVVVSAIGNTTDTLEQILDLAKNQQDYLCVFQEFKQRQYHKEADITEQLDVLQKLYEGVSLIEDYNLKIVFDI